MKSTSISKPGEEGKIDLKLGLLRKIRKLQEEQLVSSAKMLHKNNLGFDKILTHIRTHSYLLNLVIQSQTHDAIMVSSCTEGSSCCLWTPGLHEDPKAFTGRKQREEVRGRKFLFTQSSPFCLFYTLGFSKIRTLRKGLHL